MNCNDIVNFFDDSDVKRPENEAEKLLTELRDELDIAKANGKPFKSVKYVNTCLDFRNISLFLVLYRYQKRWTISVLNLKIRY